MGRKDSSIRSLIKKKEMERLSTEFKTKTNEITDNLMLKLSVYKGKLPFNLELLKMGKKMFLDDASGHQMISLFVEDSYKSWDFIHDKNEPAIINHFKEECSKKQPMFGDMLGNIIDFALTNRKKILGEGEEDKLWDDVGELIKISIQYAHIKREPKLNGEGMMKYTQRFLPFLSLKQVSEKWGVALA